MAKFYEVQLELEPIEFTYFDQWFCDENEDATQEQYADKAYEILEVWEKSLGIELPSPDFLKDGLDIGFQVVCEAIVENGYSVFFSDECIEIYSKDDSYEQEFTVYKTVEYVYTVYAKNQDEACQQVESFGSYESYSFDTVSINADAEDENETPHEFSTTASFTIEEGLKDENN